jgi:hypothetical protein
MVRNLFEQETTVSFPLIARELTAMEEIDQAMRIGYAEKKNGLDSSVDHQNTQRIKEIIAEIGWPTISKVGNEASHAAWTIVQHADHDVPFQADCLQLLKEVPPYDINPENLAYLEDRVRVNQGRPQLYGTQFYQTDTQHIPYPIEDESDVDARRAAFGMGPLQEQIDMMYEQFPLEGSTATEPHD